MRCAYREQAVSEQRPEEKTNHRIQTLVLQRLTDHLTWLTAQDEVHAGQACDLGLASIATTDFGAPHPHQCQYGAEEAEADGGDHQAPARLDVACWQRAQISQCVATVALEESRRPIHTSNKESNLSLGT